MAETRRGALGADERSASVSIAFATDGAMPADDGEETGAGGGIGLGGNGLVGWRFLLTAGTKVFATGGADMIGRDPITVATLMDGALWCGTTFPGCFSSETIDGVLANCAGGIGGRVGSGCLGGATGDGFACAAGGILVYAEKIPRKSSPGARLRETAFLPADSTGGRARCAEISALVEISAGDTEDRALKLGDRLESPTLYTRSSGAELGEKLGREVRGGFAGVGGGIFARDGSAGAACAGGELVEDEWVRGGGEAAEALNMPRKSSSGSRAAAGGGF